MEWREERSGMPDGQARILDRRTSGPDARHEVDGRKPLAPLQHFYRTSALACPYLPGRTERKLITELAGRSAASFYHDLCRAGFRRSHHLAYRPSCAGCSGCVPVRVAALDFHASRSSRRIERLNVDLVGRE